MLPSSQPIVIRLRQSGGLNDSSELSMSSKQTIHALEEEIDSLQKLVCYLLEKNERLRLRCNGSGERS